MLAPGRVAPSSSAQSELLSALPYLSGLGWGLLGLTAAAARGCLLPLVAPLGRLLCEQLRR